MSDTEDRPISDPLIDEVRAIRRAVCADFGNDVDRLCDHLVEVEREYRTRTGRFANLPRKLDAELFAESAVAPPDPGMDELRAMKDQPSSRRP